MAGEERENNLGPEGSGAEHAPDFTSDHDNQEVAPEPQGYQPTDEEAAALFAYERPSDTVDPETTDDSTEDAVDDDPSVKDEAPSEEVKDAEIDRSQIESKTPQALITVDDRAREMAQRRYEIEDGDEGNDQSPSSLNIQLGHGYSLFELVNEPSHTYRELRQIYGLTPSEVLLVMRLGNKYGEITDESQISEEDAIKIREIRSNYEKPDDQPALDIDEPPAAPEVIDSETGQPTGEGLVEVTPSDQSIGIEMDRLATPEFCETILAEGYSAEDLEREYMLTPEDAQELKNRVDMYQANKEASEANPTVPVSNGAGASENISRGAYLGRMTEDQGRYGDALEHALKFIGLNWERYRSLDEAHRLEAIRTTVATAYEKKDELDNDAILAEIKFRFEMTGAGTQYSEPEDLVRGDLSIIANTGNGLLNQVLEASKHNSQQGSFRVANYIYPKINKVFGAIRTLGGRTIATKVLGRGALGAAVVGGAGALAFKETVKNVAIGFLPGVSAVGTFMATQRGVYGALSYRELRQAINRPKDEIKADKKGYLSFKKQVDQEEKGKPKGQKLGFFGRIDKARTLNREHHTIRPEHIYRLALERNWSAIEYKTAILQNLMDERIAAGDPLSEDEPEFKLLLACLETLAIGEKSDQHDLELNRDRLSFATDSETNLQSEMMDLNDIREARILISTIAGAAVGAATFHAVAVANGLHYQNPLQTIKGWFGKGHVQPETTHFPIDTPPAPEVAPNVTPEAPVVPPVPPVAPEAPSVEVLDGTSAEIKATAAKFFGKPESDLTPYDLHLIRAHIADRLNIGELDARGHFHWNPEYIKNPSLLREHGIDIKVNPFGEGYVLDFSKLTADDLAGVAHNNALEYGQAVAELSNQADDINPGDAGGSLEQIRALFAEHSLKETMRAAGVPVDNWQLTVDPKWDKDEIAKFIRDQHRATRYFAFEATSRELYERTGLNPETNNSAQIVKAAMDRWIESRLKDEIETVKQGVGGAIKSNNQVLKEALQLHLSKDVAVNAVPFEEAADTANVSHGHTLTGQRPINNPVRPFNHPVQPQNVAKEEAFDPKILSPKEMPVPKPAPVVTDEAPHLTSSPLDRVLTGQLSDMDTTTGGVDAHSHVGVPEGVRQSVENTAAITEIGGNKSFEDYKVGTVTVDKTEVLGVETDVKAGAPLQREDIGKIMEPDTALRVGLPEVKVPVKTNILGMAGQGPSVGVVSTEGLEEL